MTKKKILVTGGSGYFGENLLSKLLYNNYTCSSLDVNVPDDKLINKIKFFKYDIRNKEKIFNASKNVDVIIHCVAQVPLAKKKKLFESVNYQGTKNILEAAYYNKCNHFIYVSSSAVFGVPQSNPVNETSPTFPKEDYGKAKLDGEKLTHEYSKKGLKATIIRPRTILGDGRLGIFQILFEWIYQGKNVPVFDGGKNIYQFVHSNDLCEAIILCIKKKKYGVYNIGAENYGTMLETLNALIIYARSNSKIRSLNSRYIIPFMNLFSYLALSPLGAYHSLMYGRSLYFDITKAKKELDWKPNFSNIEMMIESYEWYLKNRENVYLKKGGSHHKSIVKQKILSLFSKFL